MTSELTGDIHTYILNLLFDLRKEVDELDVGRQQQLPRHQTAQVKLGVQQLELHDRTATQYTQR